MSFRGGDFGVAKGKNLAVGLKKRVLMSKRTTSTIWKMEGCRYNFTPLNRNKWRDYMQELLL